MRACGRPPQVIYTGTSAGSPMHRIGRDLLWVNPDCGLKTRGWPETREALANMVADAERRRAAVPA